MNPLRSLLALLLAMPAIAGAERAVARLASGAAVTAFQSPSGEWGIRVRGSGMTSMSQPHPVVLEFYNDGWPVAPLRAGYRSIRSLPNGFAGSAQVRGHSGAQFAVEDTWVAAGAVLSLRRTLKVSGNGPGGFLSAITLATEGKFARDEVNLFAPGMIYGGSDHLTAIAIGGRETHQAGRGVLRIREDRLPAPVFGIRFGDGSSLAVLDAAPRATTTAKDASDVDVATLVDARFRFGSIGVEPADGGLGLGYWFPGSEGEVTYRGGMYPGGQVRGWRGRYHPIKEGLSQQYEVGFRFGRDASFPRFCREAWRWAWQTLKPAVVPQDIEAVRRCLIDTLAGQSLRSPDGKVGMINTLTSVPDTRGVRFKSVMGFTGKSLESAEFLLQEASRDSSERGTKLRQLGADIFDSFTRLKLSPPEGEGFDLKTGKPTTALWPRQNVVYLRSFADDLKATLRAIKRERAQGREHATWLAWVRGFGDWLLPQQRPDGGFPRSWQPVTGEVADPSPQSSYNPVPFLLLLSEITGEAKYREAALRAAEYSWASGHAHGRFVGGTIDNPDVIDKEAGTLSLEAYLAAYEATKSRKWLERAAAAADFAETWIYIWNVPMPEDAKDSELHWKRGLSTVGLQLISTGHSLADEYMSFDADEFAKVSVYLKDPHYLDVAEILLHNTKIMVALRGRTFDLKGPGWQQEHWSLAPVRGRGIHRNWHPWVATSHLNGIVGLEEFDAGLFRKLAGRK